MIDSYEKLPIGKYLGIIALPSDLPEMEYNVRVVGILAGLDDDAVLDMPLPDFQAHVAAAHFLTAPVLDKDGRHPHNGKNVADTYTLGGMKLRLAMDVTKMNVAQYVDFQTFAKGDSVQNFPQLLSCVLIPDGKTYNEGYDVLVVQDAIRRNMPTTDAFALSAFFFTALAAIHSQYPNLFPARLEEETEQDGEGLGTDKEDESDDSFAARWGWVANVDKVAEATRESWSHVWNISIVEFFNTLAYCHDKREWEKAELEKWKKTH